MNKPKKHIVIVFENMGGGHKKAAKILLSYLSMSNTRVTLISNSELVKERKNLFVSNWNALIQRNWLRLADIWLNWFSRIVLLPFYYSLYANAVARGLDALRPDILISTADVNRLLGCYAHSRGIPFFVYINSGAIFVDMLSKHARHLVYLNETAEIIRHVPITRYFNKDITQQTCWPVRIVDIILLLARYTLGYRSTPYFYHYQAGLKENNQLKVSVLGPLREKSFYKKKTPDAIKKKHHIPIDGACILISSGSLGGPILLEIINIIMSYFSSHHKGITLNLLAICGQDNVLFSEIKAIMPIETVRCIPIGQLESLSELYQIANCSIGRGTAGILMDSIVSKTPLIVMQKITMNDFGTLDVIRKYKIGAIATNLTEIPNLLYKILSEKNAYHHAINTLYEQYKTTDALPAARLQQLIMGDCIPKSHSGAN